MAAREPWQSPTVRVIAANTTEAGKIGERGAREVLYSLGYTGLDSLADGARQIDVIGRHRVEDRIAVAEAEATSKPTPGPVVDQLVGRVQMLRSEYDLRTLKHAYAISLSGFPDGLREDVRSKSDRMRGFRLHLVDGREVVKLLADGKVLLDPIAAAARAGELDGQLVDLELVAHHDGWAWAIYTGDQDVTRRVRIIHAPTGEPLAPELQQRLVELEASWRDLEVVASA